MFYRRKLTGVIALSVGVGMLLAIFLPAWMVVIAAALVIFGFWNLFFC